MRAVIDPCTYCRRRDTEVDFMHLARKFWVTAAGILAMMETGWEAGCAKESDFGKQYVVANVARM